MSDHVYKQQKVQCHSLSLLEMNNAAVSLLQAGESKGAIRMLLESLIQSQERLGNSESCTDREEHCQEIRSVGLQASPEPAADGSTSVGPKALVRVTEDQTDCGCATLGYVEFNRAFIVAKPPQSSKAAAATWIAQEVALTPVVLFNCGLVFHKVGAANGDSKFLLRALTFYKKALDAFRSQAFQEGDRSVVVFLALCMNAGQRHGDLCHYRDLEISRQIFTSTMTWAASNAEMSQEENKTFSLFRFWLKVSSQKAKVATAA
jgi:hypothetical protein